ncbi:MAG TPA: hypothetical protein VGK19_07000 [Capsulimonadaceae bacterium]|jgi:tetratricopeptide (TPR) repeat protein
MTRVQAVNLEWHLVEPGLLGIGRHSLSNSGAIATAFRDSLAARTYCLVRYTDTSHGDAEAEIGGTFAMEAIRALQVLPQGGFALAVTDDDLYFMETSSVLIGRTTYQPGRGMMFVDIDLAASDHRRTFIILSMDRTGDNYTVSAAEGGDSLVSLWAKTWMIKVTAIAVSANGEWFATGLANGSVVLMDRARQIAWESIPDADDESRPSIASLCVDSQGSVIVVDDSGEVRRHASAHGHVMWRSMLPEAQPDNHQLIASKYSVAASATTSVIAVTSIQQTTTKTGKPVAEANYAILDGESGSTVWNDRLPSAPSGVAVAPNGKTVAISCRAGDLISFSVKLSRENGLRSTTHQFALAQAMFEEARAAADAGQFTEALPLLDEALALNPTHSGATVLFDDVVWHLRSDVMKRTTEVTRENLAEVEIALKLIPYDEKLTVRRNALARLLAEKLSTEAMALDAEGREDEAIRLFVEAVNLDKNSFDVRLALKNLQDKYIRKLVQESQVCMANQDHGGAVDLLEKVRSLRPDEPGLEDRIGFSYANLAFATGMHQYNLKRYAQAAFQFRKTLALQRENVEAARYLRLSEAAARQSITIPNGNGKMRDIDTEDEPTDEAITATAAPIESAARSARSHRQPLHRPVSRSRRSFPQ